MVHHFIKEINDEIKNIFKVGSKVINYFKINLNFGNIEVTVCKVTKLTNGFKVVINNFSEKTVCTVVAKAANINTKVTNTAEVEIICTVDVKTNINKVEVKHLNVKIKDTVCKVV